MWSCSGITTTRYEQQEKNLLFSEGEVKSPSAISEFKTHHKDERKTLRVQQLVLKSKKTGEYKHPRQNTQKINRKERKVMKSFKTWNWEVCLKATWKISELWQKELWLPLHKEFFWSFCKTTLTSTHNLMLFPFLETVLGERSLCRARCCSYFWNTCSNRNITLLCL